MPSINNFCFSFTIASIDEISQVLAVWNNVPDSRKNHVHSKSSSDGSNAWIIHDHCHIGSFNSCDNNSAIDILVLDEKKSGCLFPWYDASLDYSHGNSFQVQWNLDYSNLCHPNPQLTTNYFIRNSYGLSNSKTIL